MRFRMKLLSDAIFGNGMSIPGGEDISVLHDSDGFPYYKGSTLKGIFREELLNYLVCTGVQEKEAGKTAGRLLGNAGDDVFSPEKLMFTDLTLPQAVREAVLKETGARPDRVLDAFTSLRMFTALDDEGTVRKGSLRSARCVSRGLWFEGEIACPAEQEELVKSVLGWIKWIGSMRNRGFGKVCMIVEG